MKALSIISIFFSFIGIIMSIVIIVVGLNFASIISIAEHDTAIDIANGTAIFGGSFLFIHLFLFAFSIVATISSFKKRV